MVQLRVVVILFHVLVFLEEVDVNMWVVFQLFQENMLIFMLSLWGLFILWRLWLRSDSSLVCHEFLDQRVVTWSLKER